MWSVEASQLGLSTRDPHSSREGRAEGVCLLSTHKHKHTHSRSRCYADTSHSPSLTLCCILYVFFFSCVLSRCRVLFVTPFLRSALLGSPARRLVTAPNRIRSTARLDIHDLSIHQCREGERERNGCLSVKSEIETRVEKLGWKVICKHKENTRRIICKVKPPQKCFFKENKQYVL